MSFEGFFSKFFLARNRTISNRIQIESSKPNLGQKAVVFKRFSRKIIIMVITIIIIIKLAAFTVADCVGAFIKKAVYVYIRSSSLQY